MSIRVTGTALDQIVERKASRLEESRKMNPLSLVKKLARGAPPPRDFRLALEREGVIAVIAEIKKASPSAGLLRLQLDPRDLAREYEEAGAAAVSVITEGDFFLGTLASLSEVKSAVSVPILRKDFLFDPYQIYESRAAGADAVLLIAALLEGPQLTKLMEITCSLGMAALVEVHNQDEFDRALKCGAGMIGINNRNLKNMAVDLEISRRLLPQIPPGVCRVVESGISSPSQVGRFQAMGADALLVGEVLVRQPRAGLKLQELLEGRTPCR